MKILLYHYTDLVCLKALQVTNNEWKKQYLNMCGPISLHCICSPRADIYRKYWGNPLGSLQNLTSVYNGAYLYNLAYLYDVAYLYRIHIVLHSAQYITYRKHFIVQIVISTAFLCQFIVYYVNCTGLASYKQSKCSSKLLLT